MLTEFFISFGVIFNSRACLSSSTLTAWKTFSIQWMSPLLGGSFNCFALLSRSARRASELLLTGQLSCTKNHDPFLFASLNMFSKLSRTNLAKCVPSNLSYWWHTISTFAELIATITFTTFPLLPTLPPFEVQPHTRPAHFLCQIRPWGALAWSAGFLLNQKLTQSK